MYTISRAPDSIAADVANIRRANHGAKVNLIPLAGLRDRQTFPYLFEPSERERVFPLRSKLTRLFHSQSNHCSFALLDTFNAVSLFPAHSSR